MPLTIQILPSEGYRLVEKHCDCSVSLQFSGWPSSIQCGWLPVRSVIFWFSSQCEPSAPWVLAATQLFFSKFKVGYTFLGLPYFLGNMIHDTQIADHLFDFFLLINGGHAVIGLPNESRQFLSEKLRRFSSFYSAFSSKPFLGSFQMLF